MEMIETIVERERSLDTGENEKNKPLSREATVYQVGEGGSLMTQRGYFELKPLGTYGCQADME